MDEQQKDFSDFLRTRIKRGNFSLKRLSEITGISITHLENMLKEEWSDLPPAPYLRGYLQQLGQVLDFDAEAWWLRLKQEGEVRSSGARDMLPRNRFALRTGNKYLWAIVIGVLLVGYLGVRFTKIFGQPVLIIHNPPGTITQITEPSLAVAGETRGADQLFINDEGILLDENGEWEKSVSLEPGLNTLRIVATKFLGGQTEIIRQVIYEPAAGEQVPEPASSSTDAE